MNTYFYAPSTSTIACPLVVAPEATAPFIRLCGNYRPMNPYICIPQEPIRPTGSLSSTSTSLFLSTAIQLPQTNSLLSSNDADYTVWSSRWRKAGSVQSWPRPLGTRSNLVPRPLPIAQRYQIVPDEISSGTQEGCAWECPVLNQLIWERLVLKFWRINLLDYLKLLKFPWISDRTSWRDIETSFRTELIVEENYSNAIDLP